MKEPVTPQPLLSARNAVLEAINKDNFYSEELSGLIKLWHQQIKAWEDTDTLKDAFDEGRLTLRTASHEGKHYDYGNVSEDRKRVLGVINNDSYQRDVTNQAGRDVNDQSVWVKDSLLPQNKQFNLDAGAAGIKRRTDSQNFVRPSPNARSNKHRLGLHDLSTSLLNPDGYTLKTYSGTNIVVLMPLPLPADVEVFYKLRQKSKTGGSASFKSAVEILASQFTRPKLASGLDMGTTYVIAQSARHQQDSVKYVRGKGMGVTTKDSAVTCQTTARTNYRNVLKGSTSGANEVTVAYRQNGNLNKFPCFAVCKQADEVFVEVNILLPQVQGAYAEYEDTGYVINGKTFERTKV